MATVVTDESTSSGGGTATLEGPPPADVAPADGRVFRIEPDLRFIETLSAQVGEKFRTCMQCGNCTATCALSPDLKPFPRKEMIWAAWGLKDRLMADPDLWLCYQCHDCSTRCPRGARPGDVLAAIRQQVVMHHAVPGFLARWVNRPRYVPLLVGVPALLLGAAALGRDWLGGVLGLGVEMGEPIVYSYSAFLPQWLLNVFFLSFGALVLAASVAGGVRYWRALWARGGPRGGSATPVKARGPSLTAALVRILRHREFASCTAYHSRFLAHLGVFFGFTALTLVTLWIITRGFNPFLREGFVYPFGFWSPGKLLANLGGLAVLLGGLVMFRDRLLESAAHRGANTYFQWFLIAALLAVVVTGFLTELLHYLRLEPHRHVVYFVHLVLAFVLLMTLPYSRFSHLFYRTIALVFAERTGRREAGTRSAPPVPAEAGARESAPAEAGV